MEKSELTDSLNQESTLSCSPRFITSHHDAQVAGKLTTSETTETDNMEIASSVELEDHSTLISAKVEEYPKIDKEVNESSSGNTNDDTNHSSDSESSKSDKENKVAFGNNNEDSDHNSDSESSESDKEHKVSFSGKTNDDSNHNTDSESSSDNEKEHDINFASRHPLEKETDIVSNDLKQPPLISSTVNEYSETKEVVYESAIKNTNDDMDHSSVSKSFESDKEQEVFKINTTIEECPKIDEVVYVSDIRNTINDSVSESSFESDKERDSDFAIGKFLEKEIDIIVNDDLKQSPLINTVVEECSKIDITSYEFANKDINDGMDNISESTKSDKEHEIFNISIGQSLMKETDLVENDSKTDEVTYDSAIKNINDDLENVSELTESDKEPAIFNSLVGQSSEKETDLVTNDLKQSLLVSTTIEECPVDEVIYESAIMNTTNDMDHRIISESSMSEKEHEIFNVLKQSLLISTTIEECPAEEVVYDLAIMNTTSDMNHRSISESSVSDKEHESLLISTTIEECPTDEVVYDSAIMNTSGDIEECPAEQVVYDLAMMNTNSDMDHRSISKSSVSENEQVFNFAAEKPLKMEPDEGDNYSILYDDLQEEFASGFDVIPEFHRSVSMESVESVDGSNVSEIEGESIVDRLKRQVEYDKKCINSLYNELEEERSASEVAVSQAMAMITRLQEEKATMNMDALHYLRMMEEQAEYDVEALEKANELLNEKDRDIQELEAELEYYRSIYTVDTIVEDEHEKSDDSNEEHHEYDGNHSIKSTILEASKESYRSLNDPNLSLEFEDEKHYIQLCLKSLEDKISKIFTNGQQEGEESVEENGPSRHIDQNNCNGTATPEGELVDIDKNGHFGCEESFCEVKDPISCADKLEEVDFLALEHKISELTGRLEALQADYDFLEHSLNSLRYGEEGLQFARNIVNQLQELCKIGIRLDRRPRSKLHAA